MKKMTAILSLLLITSTSFAKVVIGCAGLDNGQEINSKISDVVFQGALTTDIEEKELVLLNDGRSISLLLEAHKNVSKSALSIVVKDKDSKGQKMNRLIRGSLSQGVSYSELPEDGMATMIACKRVAQ